MAKDTGAYRTIGEVADALGLPQHVLRYWESRFPQLSPLKRAGGRRYYRPEEVVLLATIKRLVQDEGYTLKGVQRALKNGPRATAGPQVSDAGEDEPVPAAGSALSEDIAPGASARPELLAGLADEIEACALILEAARRVAMNDPA